MATSTSTRSARPKLIGGAGTLERLVPDRVHMGETTGRDTLELHLSRYEFAARHARPTRLLDISCGVGYGTRLLVDRCPEIRQAVGVDIDESSVAYARQRYASPKTKFLACDCMKFEDEPFDTIVSLETIEHLRQPAAFVARLASLLRADGVIIASVPTTPSVDGNPHHLHDFSESSFRRLFEPHGLVEVACHRQSQPFNPIRVLSNAEARTNDVRRNLGAWYMRHPGSLARRVMSTLRHGFVNRYATIVWRKG